MQGSVPASPPGKLLAIMRFIESKPEAVVRNDAQEPALEWYHDSATVMIRAAPAATMDSMFTREGAAELRSMHLVTEACVATFVRSLSDYGFRVNADAKKRGVKALLCPGFYRMMDAAAAEALPSRRKPACARPTAAKRARSAEDGTGGQLDAAPPPPNPEALVPKRHRSAAVTMADFHQCVHGMEQKWSMAFQNMADVLQPVLSGLAVRFDEVSAKLAVMEQVHQDMAGRVGGMQHACAMLADTTSLHARFDKSFFG